MCVLFFKLLFIKIIVPVPHCFDIKAYCGQIYLNILILKQSI